MIDRPLKESDVQELNRADAVAAFFAALGYATDSRIRQTPANLGISNDTLARQITRLELLADQEALLQVYLVELSSLTIQATRGLAAALRNRPPNCLLVLTTDYERIDFVLLERSAPKAYPSNGLTQRQVAVRPRVLSVERRRPGKVELRVLRRLTYTESDPLAQYDKLRSAFDIADWSEENFNNRALFADHFLRERLPEMAPWCEDPKPALQALRRLLDRAANRWNGKPEEETRAGLIVPALETLGFKVEAGKSSGDDGPQPDYVLCGLDGRPLATCLAYPWARSLDGKDDTRDSHTPDENPGAVVVTVLAQGAAPFAVVTNGKHWRLYTGRASSRATSYYEIDLEETLALDDPADAFRYFWLVFRREAFANRFLDALLDGSAEYATRLGESLKERVFEEIFPELADGFLRVVAGGTHKQAAIDEELLRGTFGATLTFLYRLLFLLYAEARGLLPVSEAAGYESASLTRIKREIAEVGGTVRDEAPVILAERYGSKSSKLHDRLDALFRVIDKGDLALNVPAYNGGLFLTEVTADLAGTEAATARFLEHYRLSDGCLARTIDRLARDVDDKTHALAPIDYKSLGVRQLGSIYEGLLEFRLRVASEKMAVCKGKRTEEVIPYREAKEKRRVILRRGSGKAAPERVLPKGSIYLENDRHERKATGSYYTPDYIVKHIVERTVGPVLDAKLEALAPNLREAQKALRLSRDRAGKSESSERQIAAKHRALIDQLFDLRVCDPAMGSGHFLVEVVDYVSDRLIDFLNGFPRNPVVGELEETRESILKEMEEQRVSIDPQRLTDVNLLKRRVLKRCIYGVDVNPMAVELAKVSLWLHCFTLGAPLSFLDHHLKPGNSLLGARLGPVLRALEGDLFAGHLGGVMKAAEAMVRVGDLADVTLRQVRESAVAFREARELLEPFSEVLDLWQSQHHGNAGAKSLLFSNRFPEIARGWQDRLSSKTRGFAESASAIAARLRLFHWELEFPELFFAGGLRKVHGGFDAIVGNPPWIRQESLSQSKDALKASFPEVFDSVADTYVFFLARGLGLLLPGGRLGMIVPNKWLRAGYGKKLREHLVAATPPRELVDFGHAPIFPDADTFPCIGVFEAPAEGRERDDSVVVCAISRDELDPDGLPELVRERSHRVPLVRLRPEGWDLEDQAVAALLEKIRRAGISLKDYVGKPYRGILTGLNEAFLIDQATRDRLVAEDPKCEPVIRRFLRGRDIDRWHPEWGGEWMIFARRGIEIDRYPSIKRHLSAFRTQLEPRPRDWDVERNGNWPGRKPGFYEWYELQDTIDYHEEFSKPKIISGE